MSTVAYNHHNCNERPYHSDNDDCCRSTDDGYDDIIVDLVARIILSCSIDNSLSTLGTGKILRALAKGLWSIPLYTGTRVSTGVALTETNCRVVLVACVSSEPRGTQTIIGSVKAPVILRATNSAGAIVQAWVLIASRYIDLSVTVGACPTWRTLTVCLTNTLMNIVNNIQSIWSTGYTVT